MGSNDNSKVILSVYEAFSRGDIETILAAVADEVDWGVETSTSVAPWYGVKRDKAGIAGFFEEFAKAMEVDEFRPITVAAQDDYVLSVVRCRCRSRATGRALDMGLHHLFGFEGGKIAYFRGSEDTAQVAEALAP
jgi:ketosteroid isomerase-like protein